jgi:hypothetical protein
MIQKEDISFKSVPVLQAQLELYQTLKDLKVDLRQAYQEMTLWFDVKAIAAIMHTKPAFVIEALQPKVAIDQAVTDAILKFKDSLLYNRTEEEIEEKKVPVNSAFNSHSPIN